MAKRYKKRKPSKVKRSGIIPHWFDPLPRSHPFRIATKHALIDPWTIQGPSERDTDIAKMSDLQYAYRGQLFRLHQQKKDLLNLKTLTYHANCYPTGFNTKPFTVFCKKPFSCPWCSVRRAIEIYDLLVEQSKLYELSNVLIWKQVCKWPSSADDLPFFRAGRGPQSWTKAPLSVQTLLPSAETPTTGVQAKNAMSVCHLGFQLTEKFSKQEASAMADKFNKAAISVSSVSMKDQEKVLVAIANNFAIPWNLFLAKENLNNFYLLRNLFRNKNLLRVSGRSIPVETRKAIAAKRKRKINE